MEILLSITSESRSISRTSTRSFASVAALDAFGFFDNDTYLLALTFSLEQPPLTFAKHSRS